MKFTAKLELTKIFLIAGFFGSSITGVFNRFSE
jgi:hypothetical protein